MNGIKEKEFELIKRINREDILMYKIMSHPFASSISNPFLQIIMSKYFAWKVRRKYRRYHYTILIRDSLQKRKPLENQVRKENVK